MQIGMNIWIDMDNSPHVPLLIPFVKNFESRGYSTTITCRDYAQTVDLLRANRHTFTIIGKHGGAGKIKKTVSTLRRVWRLIKFARGKDIRLAVNHGSRSQTLACMLMRIPCFVGMDYEHTESMIFSRFATRIWMPKLLFPKALPIIGIRAEQALVYEGIKEQFYLEKFEPDPDFKRTNGIPSDKIFIALRPPAELANYHDPRSETLLLKMIERIKASRNVFTLCFPRTNDQAKRLREFASDDFVVCDKVLDGKNVVYYADVMISGGGTMNREAAYFDAAVYSIFSGPKPLIDSKLQSMGALIFIENETQIQAIEFQKKSKGASKFPIQSNTVINHLIERFLNNIPHRYERRIRGSKTKLLIDQE